MGAKNLQASKAEIADFCRRHHVRKLSVFGSVLRDDFHRESDVDILVRCMRRASVPARRDSGF